MPATDSHIFNAFTLGIHRTPQLNELTHFLLSVLTSPAGGKATAAVLFLLNKRSQVLQGMLGISQQDSLIALPLGCEPQYYSHPRITKEVQLLQRDTAFNRSAIRLRFHLADTAPITLACKEGIVRSQTIASGDDELSALFSQFFPTQQYNCVPMCGREGLIGAIVLNYNKESLLSEESLAAESFVQHAEVAIDNVLLRRCLENTNEELRGIEAHSQQDEKMAILGELVASVAHDLKNPLIAIGGFARRLEPLVAGEVALSYVETIRRESHRLEEIIGGILSFSRKQMMCFDSCQLIDLISSILTKESLARTQANILIDLQHDPHLPEISGDIIRLSQLFTNLIQNAIQAMPTGGTLSLRLRKIRLRGERAVQIDITDTGPGVPDEIIGNIFKPFFTTRAEGTGLGLAICSRITEQHQGKIKLLNSPTGGALFRVTLPCSPTTPIFPSNQKMP